MYFGSIRTYRLNNLQARIGFSDPKNIESSWFFLSPMIAWYQSMHSNKTNRKWRFWPKIDYAARKPVINKKNHMLWFSVLYWRPSIGLRVMNFKIWKFPKNEPNLHSSHLLLHKILNVIECPLFIFIICMVFLNIENVQIWGRIRYLAAPTSITVVNTIWTHSSIEKKNKMSQNIKNTHIIWFQILSKYIHALYGTRTTVYHGFCYFHFHSYVVCFDLIERK